MIGTLKEAEGSWGGEGSSKTLLRKKAYPGVTSNHLGLKSGPACEDLNQFL